jgi:hypothetical protein
MFSLVTFFAPKKVTRAQRGKSRSHTLFCVVGQHEIIAAMKYK